MEHKYTDIKSTVTIIKIPVPNYYQLNSGHH